MLDPGWFDDDDYKSLLVLGGMTAPLGALFQAPMLGTLMIHELGEPPKYDPSVCYAETELSLITHAVLWWWVLCRSFMESTTILAISAVVCFVVYYEMVTASYIEHVTQRGIVVRTHSNPFPCPTPLLAQAIG